jgi:hypothetical protein
MLPPKSAVEVEFTMAGPPARELRQLSGVNPTRE